MVDIASTVPLSLSKVQILTDSPTRPGPTLDPLHQPVVDGVTGPQELSSASGKQLTISLQTRRNKEAAVLCSNKYTGGRVGAEHYINNF